VLDTFAKGLDIGAVVDFLQALVDLVAVLLNRRAVCPILDHYQLLEHLRQLVVGVGYAVGDEALVEWCQMVRGTKRYASAAD
jgi:hypothetical protein